MPHSNVAQIVSFCLLWRRMPLCLNYLIPPSFFHWLQPTSPSHQQTGPLACPLPWQLNSCDAPMYPANRPISSCWWFLFLFAGQASSPFQHNGKIWSVYKDCTSLDVYKFAGDVSELVPPGSVRNTCRNPQHVPLLHLCKGTRSQQRAQNTTEENSTHRIGWIWRE